MIRRHKWLIAAFFVFYCSSVLAVGLGELVLNSALNQPFDAEVSLKSTNKLAQEEIVAQLASPSDFDRVGVDRSYQLNDLRFVVKARFDGDYYIHLTSNRPIIEPFLNFIVEVTWPTGRILREYTVLLDPPVFDFGKVEPIDPSASARRSGTEKREKGGVSYLEGERKFSSSSGYIESRVQNSGREIDGYLIGPGDTLWEIAQRVRPYKSMPVPPIMLAIQRENPEAFIRNNINLLKAGYVLRIPDLNDPSSEALQEAVAEVKAQNEEYVGSGNDELTQLDAGQKLRSEMQDLSETLRDDDELRLLVSAGQSGRGGGSDGDMSAKLESSLSAVREELDVTRRSNNELAVRLDDLATQVQTLNDIVTLKDDQLAALQAELEKARSAETSTVLRASTSSSVQPKKAFSFLNNPIILSGLVLALIGIMATAMTLVGRRRKHTELEDDVYQSAAAEKTLENSSDSETGSEVVEDWEEVTQKSCELIVEADTNIAHGRFKQAISSLQKGLEVEPDRADLQLKLLEVYVLTEDFKAFDLQRQRLNSLGDGEADEHASELEKQLPGRGEDSFTIAAVGPSTEKGRLGVSGDDQVDVLPSKAEGLGFGDLGNGLDTTPEETNAELSEIQSLEDELFLDLEEFDIGGDQEAEAVELDLDSVDEIELDIDDDLDLDQDAGSKLGLARAYIEMGDNDGAREVLKEVAREGTELESAEANELLGKLD